MQAPSLLDQAIAHGGGAVRAAEVARMLGTLDQGRVLKLLETLVAGEAGAVIGTARALAEFAPDYGQVLGELLSLLRRVAVVQALDAAASEVEDEAQVIALADRLSPEDCQLCCQMPCSGGAICSTRPSPNRFPK